MKQVTFFNLPKDLKRCKMARYFIVVFVGLALCISIAAADKETSKSEVCYYNLYLTVEISRIRPFLYEVN